MASPMSPTRARTQAAIVAAAETAFRELGFEQTSMEDVARRAGVARGTLYYNFSSKEDIAIGVAERYRADGYARMLEDRATGLPALELLDRFFVFAGRWISANREAALAGTMASVRGIGRAPGRPGTTTVFVDLIGQGQREGTIRDDLEPMLLARLLTSFLLQAALFGPDESDSEAAEWPRRLFHAALDGLGA